MINTQPSGGKTANGLLQHVLISKRQSAQNVPTFGGPKFLIVGRNTNPPALVGLPETESLQGAGPLSRFPGGVTPAGGLIISQQLGRLP